MRQEVFAQLIDDFRGVASLRFEVQGNVTDALVLLTLPVFDQCVSSGTQHAPRLEGIVRISVQVEQSAVAIGLVNVVATGCTPPLDDLGSQGWIGSVGKDAVTVFTNPLKRLAGLADDKVGIREPTGFGTRSMSPFNWP